MREDFVRFKHHGKAAWAKKSGEHLNVLSAAPWADGVKPTGESLSASGVEWLAPAEPSKIICVGLNYRDHAAEMGEHLPDEPKLFMKPSTALLDPGKSIVMPRSSSRVDYEAELAFVVGKQVGPGHDHEDALFGFTCANDVTARDLQKKDGQWTRAKGFDTFCPLGPTLVRGIDVDDLAVECWVNGQRKQGSRTSQLIFGPHQILNFIAEVMTLLPGDVILTGTPGGIGPLQAGDEVEVRIEGVGSLSNIAISR
jgi:2-keto-4-pentenoate hydratase/2-oxohepta-3-ene-1,7-dioic acid hydratase in catechol pathway